MLCMCSARARRCRAQRDALLISSLKPSNHISICRIFVLVLVLVLLLFLLLVLVLVVVVVVTPAVIFLNLVAAENRQVGGVFIFV